MLAGGVLGVFLRNLVRDRYAAAANAVTGGATSCCDGGSCSPPGGLVDVTPTRQVADGMHSAIIRARRPN